MPAGGPPISGAAPFSETHLKLPLQFGPYQLLERVSVGGMAEVYKAKEYGVEGFERTVAVKRILPHVAEDEEFIAMFKDEAKIAVQLSHGNIAQIYNLGNHEDSFYIALEYVAGRDLRTIFQREQQQRQHMPVAQACYIIMKVCEGLDYAHNKKDKYGRELNIVHRDVSPPNILVSYEGEVKLIDFGVAKAAGRASKTQAGILKGKFGYMSPEQVRGMPLDRRSDVFSVGVVLWEILTAQRLFQGETDFATLEKVRAVEVPRPSEVNTEIPQALEDIAFKALAREPEERYQSAIELHDELQAFMFAQGLFYSRKDLATWMRTQYAKEIELEKESNKAGVQPPPPPKGKKPPPPPAGAKPPPPPPRKQANTPPPVAAVSAQGLPPTDAPLALGKPPMPPSSGPRKRSPTLMMSPNRTGLPVPAGLPRPGGMTPRPGAMSLPKPAASKPMPQGRGPTATTGGPVAAPSSDFDWDDDELETRLFDGEGHGPFQPPAAAPHPGGGPKVEVAPGVKVIQPRPGAQPISVGGAQQHFGAQMPGAGAVSVQPDRAFQASSGADWERPAGTPRTGLILGLGAALVAAIVLLAVVVAALGNNEEKATEEAVAGASKGTGSLTLNITPGDALVLVDGQMVGGSSPFIVSDLPTGAHKVSVTKEGFLPLEREVLVQAGVPVMIQHQLAFRDVTLQLDTTPKSAKVTLFINGEPMPLGSGGEAHKLTRRPDADYEVQASAPGYISTKVPLVFSGAAVETVRISLVRDASAAPSPPSRPSRSSSSSSRSRSRPSTSSSAAAKTATLAVGVAPGNKPASVSVDGASIGTTPKIHKVSPGSHSVRCSWPDGATDTHTVTAADGARQVVRCSP